MSQNLYHATFILPDGTAQKVSGEEGDNLLELAHRNKIPLEGACEGALACSTCHVVVDKVWFSRLNTPEDAEEDMLDYAFGLTATSRLGCQIKLGPATDGIVVTLPKATRNMMVDKSS